MKTIHTGKLLIVALATLVCGNLSARIYLPPPPSSCPALYDTVCANKNGTLQSYANTCAAQTDNAVPVSKGMCPRTAPGPQSCAEANCSSDMSCKVFATGSFQIARCIPRQVKQPVIKQQVIKKPTVTQSEISSGKASICKIWEKRLAEATSANNARRIKGLKRLIARRCNDNSEDRSTRSRQKLGNSLSGSYACDQWKTRMEAAVANGNARRKRTFERLYKQRCN